MRSFYWIVYASIPTSDLSEPNCSSSSVGLTPIVILSTDHTTADRMKTNITTEKAPIVCVTKDVSGFVIATAIVPHIPAIK